MDEYGFQAINDYNSVTVSSTYKVMVFSERGTVRITSPYTNREGVGQATFIRPINTQEPPQIFIRVASASHASIGLITTVLGGPGNWTGFILVTAVAGGNTLQNHLLEFVSCKFTDTAQNAGYGMNIWDANSRPVFATSDKVVRYSKFATTWTLALDTMYQRVFTPNVTIVADDFICVSAMDRGVNWFAGNAHFAGFNVWASWAPNLNIHYQRDTQGGYWYWQGTNNTQFTVAVCKFPAERYHN